MLFNTVLFTGNANPVLAREIARALVITEGTAANHVNHILNKLDFSSRAQIAAWVAEQGLGPTGTGNGQPRP